MANKEIIIANLRKQLSKISEVYNSINDVQSEISEIISELEDDSKLGSPANYDYGSGKLKIIKKKLLTNIKKDIKSLEIVAESIENLQKESTKKNTSTIEKYDTE